MGKVVTMEQLTATQTLLLSNSTLPPVAKQELMTGVTGSLSGSVPVMVKLAGVFIKVMM